MKHVVEMISTVSSSQRGKGNKIVNGSKSIENRRGEQPLNQSIYCFGEERKPQRPMEMSAD